MEIVPQNMKFDLLINAHKRFLLPAKLLVLPNLHHSHDRIKFHKILPSPEAMKLENMFKQLSFVVFRKIQLRHI
jgi:hypothetical protein